MRKPHFDMKKDRTDPRSDRNARVRAGVACAGVLWLAGILVPCRAAITNALVNGNFDSQTGNFESQVVSNWIESSTAANYNDWVKSGTVDAGQFPAAQSNVVNFSNSNGYIYQSIGTYAGEIAVDITGKAIRRYPGAQRAFRPFSVGIYETATNVNGATGVAPASLAGSILIAAATFTDAQLGLTGVYSAPQMTNFICTMPVSNAVVGQKLWLAFQALAGADETALDDLGISINNNYVPPPPPGPVAYGTLQVISNGDSPAMIVEKAAKLLPRTNQVEWMNLEQTYFTHFGVNTFTGLEQGTGQESPTIFNPSELDASQWIREIKNSGGKMEVLVCKHQDGFCLWPSRYTAHSVASSPWLGGTGNVMRMVSDAAQAQGLKLGFYLSPADVYQVTTNPVNPSGYYGNNSAIVPSVIPTDPASFQSNPMNGRVPPPGFTSYTYSVDDYNRYFLNQLYELLTEYGPIKEVWFDGANFITGTTESYNYAAWYDLIHNLQPNAIIFGKGPDARWVGNENGVARNSEWSVIPLSSPPDSFTWPDMTATDLGSRSKLIPGSYLWWYPAEADVPILSGWFWAPGKTVKTASNLVDIFYSSVGLNANRILNVSPDMRGLLPDDQVGVLRAMGQIIGNTFTDNLAAGAAVTADTSNPTNDPSLVLDDNLNTWWEAAAGQTNGTLTLTMSANITFDVVSLQEAAAQRGQRIETFSIDTWNGSSWVTATNLTTVGHKRLVRLSVPVTTSRIRVRVTGSRWEPTLASVGLFKLAAAVIAPTISNRDANGLITLNNTGGYPMVYTLDGSFPTANSPVYIEPFALPFGGTVAANCLTPQGQPGTVATKFFAGEPSVGWTVVDVDSQETVQTNGAAINAIDGSTNTLWLTRLTADLALPHHITVDMATPRWVGGFAYVPRTDGNPNGIVKRYRFETSLDAAAWNTNVAAGLYSNLVNHPDPMLTPFAPVNARFFRFTALQEINSNGWASAAEITVLPGGFDAWRQGIAFQTNAPLSDPEGDGIPLLMEYFRGVAPGTRTNSALAAASAAGGFFTFDVRREPGRADLSQSYQISTDLNSWSPASGVTTNSITAEFDGTETLHLTMPLPPAHAIFYVRLVVTLN
jgi:alpha-L-fucosidase